LEKKRVRRILEEETIEYKALQSQAMQSDKRNPRPEKKTRMAGNTMEKK